MIQLINSIVLSHPDGIPEARLVEIDPFHFTNATINQNSNGPVSINLRLTDGNIFGWKYLKITKLV